jgi:hypothetical protein
MHWYYREPTLQDMLSDSIVKDLMAADGVDPRELEEALMQVRSSRISQAGRLDPLPAWVRLG